MNVWQDVTAATLVAAALVWLVGHFRHGLSGESTDGCPSCSGCGTRAKEPDLVKIELPAKEQGP